MNIRKKQSTAHRFVKPRAKVAASFAKPESEATENPPVVTRKFFPFAQRCVRKLADGEILIVIEGIEQLVTAGFCLGKEGIVADSRQGKAVATFYLRNGDRFVAFPVTFFAYFDRVSPSGWRCELALGIGGIVGESAYLENIWGNVIPMEQFALRIALDPAVVEQLNIGDVITPNGDNLGKGHPALERVDPPAEDKEIGADNLSPASSPDESLERVAKAPLCVATNPF